MTPDRAKCDQALARLIASTRRKKRPQSLVGVARDIDTAVACLGNISAVADQVGLSTSMLRRFLLVRQLTPGLVKLVEQRVVDSIDAVAELSSLSSDQQDQIGSILPTQAFTTEDVRGIVRLLNDPEPLSIEEIIQKVVASRTTRLFVYEFVARQSSKDPAGLRACFSKALPSDAIHDIEIQGSTGRLKVTAEGRRSLSAIAKARRMTVTRLVQEIASGKTL